MEWRRKYSGSCPQGPAKSYLTFFICCLIKIITLQINIHKCFSYLRNFSSLYVQLVGVGEHPEELPEGVLAFPLALLLPQIDRQIPKGTGCIREEYQNKPHEVVVSTPGQGALNYKPSAKKFKIFVCIIYLLTCPQSCWCELCDPLASGSFRNG